MALSRSERPSTNPSTKPLETPAVKPKRVFLRVIAVANQRLFWFRAMHFAKSPFAQPLRAPVFDLMQLKTRKLSKISDGFETKYGSSKSGTSHGRLVWRSYPHC